MAPVPEAVTCDVLVVGSGAAGLTAAITARRAGLEVIITEKTEFYGGTTALSGGFAWLPCNSKAGAEGIADSRAAALDYLRFEAGNCFDSARAEAFVDNAGAMMEAIERDSAMEFFLAPEFPDYHPDAPGGMSGGRSLGSVEYDGRKLGKHFKRMRRPLPQITFFGMFLGSGQEIQHYFNVTRSVRSAWFVARRSAGHIRDMLVHGRGAKLTQGGAMVARLARTVFDLEIPLWLSSPVERLTLEGGRVTGATVARIGADVEVRARRGVLLASGGFPGNSVRRASVFPHAAQGHDHVSVALPTNVGDGAKLAEGVGGAFSAHVLRGAPLLPVSLIPGKTGNEAAFPHLIDRTKPGIIAVLRNGKRFVNEAASYHDFVVALIDAASGTGAPEAFMIADRRALARYGLGYAKPFPLPHSHLVRAGYLLRASTLDGLAELAGIDREGLEATIATLNTDAAAGRDTAFGRGDGAYDRYQGDPHHAPNSCLGPIATPPFYAVRVIPGDIGSFAGLRTDGHARVLDGDGRVVAGLYAAGADSVHVGGGSYPGAGANIGPAMTFGFIAAKAMAAEAR